MKLLQKIKQTPRYIDLFMYLLSMDREELKCASVTYNSFKVDGINLSITASVRMTYGHYKGEELPTTVVKLIYELFEQRFFK